MMKHKASRTGNVRRTALAPMHQVARPGSGGGERTSAAYGIVARPAGPSASNDSPALSEAVPRTMLVGLASAIFIRPAAAMGRLLLGWQISRVSGFRRKGYPEIEYWLAGREYPFDDSSSNR